MKRSTKEFQNDSFQLFEKSSDTDHFRVFTSLQEKVVDSFFADVDDGPSQGDLFHDIRNTIRSPRKIPRRDPSQQFQSTHSLAYSESSCEDLVEFTEAHKMSSFRFSEVKDTKSPAAINDQRVPLSPLNVIRPSKHRARSPRKFVDIESRPDPDAAWASFPGAFEKKPDPKGDDSKILQLPSALAEQSRLQDQNIPGQRLSFVAIPEGPVDEEDDIDDDDPDHEYGYVRHPSSFAQPIGIQSLPHANETSFCISSSPRGLIPGNLMSFHSRSVHDMSLSSSSRSSSHDVSDMSRGRVRPPKHEKNGDRGCRISNSRVHRDNALCFHGLPKSRCLHLDDNEEDSMGKNSMSSVSFTKPLGVPNNAIMASMLFRRHYSNDAHVVEEKLKAKEQEYKPDRSRGDIPRCIQALDGVSCVSSFSEDTAAQIAAWRKPTRDLLEHFSRSHRIDYNIYSKGHTKRTEESELFEA